MARATTPYRICASSTAPRMISSDFAAGTIAKGVDFEARAKA